jgi:NADPH:quinone reductase
VKRFSNLESATVEDSQKLDAALVDSQTLIDDELFKTRIGREFRFDEIDVAKSRPTQRRR